MKCRNCGYEFPDGTNVCPACGVDKRILEDKKKTASPPTSRPKPKQEPAVTKFFNYMSESALYKYALAVYNGYGMEKDLDIARRAFLKLSERGNVEAMYMLAGILLEGDGRDLKPDLKEAVYWYKMSASGGYLPANNKINYLLDKKLISEDDLKIIDVGFIAGMNEIGAQVYEKNRLSVLDIKYSGPNGSWVGSGYVISPDGYILTNAHVVMDEFGNIVPSVSVGIDGYSIRADVVYVGSYNKLKADGVDLALCKLFNMPGQIHPVMFADFSTVHNGDTVYTIGNSLGEGLCITKGIISDKNRRLGKRELIMTDCAINGGNSGSPLLNAAGQVVGTMCCHRASSDNMTDTVQGMNYAVSTPIAFDFLSQCGMDITVYVVTKTSPSGARKVL